MNNNSRRKAHLTKKRKSSGRHKSNAGVKGVVQCSYCGRLVPRDKAKRVTRYISPVDPQLARELRKQGAYIARQKQVAYYCVSCAVHIGKVKVRSRAERKSRR